MPAELGASASIRPPGNAAQHGGADERERRHAKAARLGRERGHARAARLGRERALRGVRTGAAPCSEQGGQESAEKAGSGTPGGRRREGQGAAGRRASAGRERWADRRGRERRAGFGKMDSH